MAKTPVEVKKTTPAVRTPDVWQSLRSEMDRLFDRFSAGFGMPAFRRMFDVAPTFQSSFSFPTPAVDVTEDDKAYKVTAELPGLEEKDVNVTVTDNMLTIKGEKSYEKEEKNKDHHMSERAYGSFERSFTLPSTVDAEHIKASYDLGVLTVRLPKAERAKPRQIEVKVEASK